MLPIQAWRSACNTRFDCAAGRAIMPCEKLRQALDLMLFGIGQNGPAPMAGRGLYNRSSHVQAAAVRPAIPLLERAANAVPLVDLPEPIVIADYGSSEGRNSIEPMRIAIRALRNRMGADHPISVFHIDLPGNDFGSLFRTLTDNPDSYLRDDPATNAAAVARSFYEQVMPSSSVTLGWSAWALHYLSRAPVLIPDHVHYAGSRDVAVRAAFASQSKNDWEAFLQNRARELRPGGRLIILTKAALPDGDSGHQARLIDAIQKSLMKLVDQGHVSISEVYRMVIPVVSRLKADLLAPFSKPGRFAELSVEHAEMFSGDDIIWREFERDRDAVKYGARWAAFSRASVFPTLAMGLQVGSDNSRVIDFLDRLEMGMAAELALAPQPLAIPLASIVLAKGYK